MFGMDTMTFNKIAGAFLGAALLVMGLNIVSEGIYHAEKPEQTAIAIEIPEGEDDGKAAAAETPMVSLASLMASADAAKGESAFKACKACHTAEDGGANKVGPNLYGIVDRAVASHEGFAYSDALKGKASETWSFEHLNAFILKPKDWAPGTKMGYGGLKNDAKRADLLAYLRTLSANPVDLPVESAAQPTETQPSAEQPAETQPSAEQPKAMDGSAEPPKE